MMFPSAKYLHSLRHKENSIRNHEDIHEGVSIFSKRLILAICTTIYFLHFNLMHMDIKLNQPAIELNISIYFQ